MDIQEYLAKAMRLPLENRRSALAALRDRGVSLRHELPPATAGDRSPLSPQQQDLWAYEALYPGAALNLCGAYWFQDELNVAALSKALAELSSRHALLRARFSRDVDGIWQEPVPDAIKMGSRDDVATEEQARVLIERFAATPFDLSSEHPMRALLMTGPGVGYGVLVMAFHHIVTDWWSFDLLHAELSDLYEAYTRGEAAPASDLIDYRDFASWWSELDSMHVWDDELSYWEQKLRDLPAPLFGEGLADPTSDRLDVTLSPDLRTLIREAAVRHGASPSTVALTCFGAFLASVTGRSDFLIGTPLANRDLPGATKMLGYVMNMVPVRMCPRQGESAEEAISRTGDAFRQSLLHGKVPLGRITDRVSPQRRGGRAPLYQAVFMYLPEQDSGKELPARARFERIHTGSEENDFVTILRERGEALDLTFEFRSAAVSFNVAREWVALFETSVRTLLSPDRHVLGAAPESRSGELSVKEGPVRDWEEQTLLGLLDRNDPDRPAIFDGDLKLTFGDLQALSDALAMELVSHGVRHGDVVGLHLERGYAAVAAMIGVMKAGAAYLPLDPAYPKARLAWMLSDAGARLVVGDGNMDRLDSQLPYLGFSTETSPRAPRPLVEVRDDDLAYIMYTSGSTGSPKGVGVPHRAATNLAQSQAENLGLASTDVMLQFSSLSFDASIEEIWACWSRGGSLVVGAGLITETLTDLCRFIDATGITVLDLPTGMWELLTTSEETSFGPQLRAVVIGGESFSIPALRRWSERWPHIELLNTYGPTECTVSSTWGVITLKEALEHGQVIGHPLANVRVSVVNSAGEPVERGAEGELVIGGAGVAPGYIGAAATLESRFTVLSHEHVYRTGDRVRMLDDGQLAFLGRVDDQVKLRGFRIELHSIEQILLESRAVDGVAVVVEGSGASARLLGFFTGAVEGGDALRRHAERELPPHERPGLFVHVPRMPLTPSGKVDRELLRRQARAAQEPVDGPRFANPHEETIAAVWTDALGAADVGRHSNFFDLGGTSLLAISVSQELSKALRATVAPRDVYEAPTPAALATRIGDDEVVPITPHRGRREGYFPLAPMQAGLRYLQEVESSTDPYVITDVWAVTGNVKQTVVTSALRTLVARHEALRTTFPWTSAGPVQEVHAWIDPVIHRVGDDGDEQLRALVRKAAQTTMNLTVGPLLHAWLVGDEHVRFVVVAVHHIVSDGHSMSILQREFDHVLSGRRLPPVALHPADVALAADSRAASEGFQAARDEWVEKLADAPATLLLPWDRPRHVVRSTAGESIELEVDHALHARLAQFARNVGTTEFVVLLTAFEITMHHLSGMDDLLVGVPFGGRSQHELANTVGLFVNTLPVRSMDVCNRPFIESTLATHRRVIDVMHRQEVPFDEIVKAVNPHRDVASHPLFQVVFAWEDRGGEIELPANLGGLSKYDLACTAVRKREGLRLRFEWRADILDTSTAMRWAAILNNVLVSAIDDPHSAPRTASEDGRAGMVLAARTGQATDLAGLDPVGLIMHAIRQHPDHIAIETSSSQLTYAQFGERAQALALQLRRHGVPRGSTVGILAAPGEELYCAVLGVLMAACSFVLFSPETPRSRLRFLVEDSKSRAVLAGRVTASAQDLGVEIIDLGEAIDYSVVKRGGWPMSEHSAFDVAYVCYTSGSTGQPKGVRISRLSLANLAVEQGRSFGLTANDRVLQYAPLSFDAAISEMFVTWVHGATLVVGDSAHRVGALLESELERLSVSFVTLPPTVISQLEPMNVPTLRTLVTAGERCPAWLYARWSPHCRVLNAYGPTEATVCATVGVLTADRPTGAGVPIANVGVEIRDECGRGVPVDVVGEIVITGGGVALGYIDRPDEEARSFREESAGRIYRTGDMGRIRGDGSLDVLGRRDDQLKFRGVRIEPGEVENEATRLGEVRQAALVVQTRGDHEELVLFCVAEDNVHTTDIRAFLRSRLPRAMVPSLVVAVRDLPVTTNGKLDRRALEIWEVGIKPAESKAHDEDWTPAMRRVSDVWTEVLSHLNLHPDDNFFDIGGDSILAVEVASRLAPDDAGAVLMALYTTQTIRALAATIETEE